MAVCVCLFVWFCMGGFDFFCFGFGFSCFLVVGLFVCLSVCCFCVGGELLAWG